MSLLVLENIKKEFSNRIVLDSVSLRVERGERLALIGPNGSGKSTLLKIAMGLETCDSGNASIARNIRVAYLSQSISEVKGQENTADTALCYEKVLKLEREIKSLERKMAKLNPGDASQDRILNEYSSLLSRYEAVDGYNVETNIKKILMGLGLREEALTIPFDSLSGGEKMRASIARMLLEEPDLLILDEPTNHLDIQATEWIEDFLKKFEGGVLVVSHDRYFLDHVSTRVAELENGSITERSGSYNSFMEQKRIMREFLLREQKRLELQKKADNEIIQKFKTMRKISAIKSREIISRRRNGELGSKLEDMKRSQHLYRGSAPKIQLVKVKHTSKDIVSVKGLTKRFGDLRILDNIDFHIAGGERVGIIGSNGCGKTTLIKILLGMDADYEGHARLGEWVKYAYLGQEISFEDESRTVLQEVIAKKEMTVPEALRYLAKFQFYGDETSKAISVLSGGERVRLYLACTLLDEPTCLIMDEPTNHLDIQAREALEAALLGFKGTVMAVTHDRYFLDNCVSRILEITGGKMNSYLGNYENYRRLKCQNSLGGEQPKEKGIEKAGSKIITKRGAAFDKKVKMDRSAVEDNIIKLEQRAGEMEASFDKSTTPEKYDEYNNLLREIEDLYSLWDETS